MKYINFSHYPKSKKPTSLLFVLAFAVIGSALLLISRAASPFASIEPERGTLAGTATVVSDTTASSGTAVQFAGTPVANEFPTPQTTGPRTTSLADSGPIVSSTDGQLIERKNVTGQIRIKHDNVTVRDVKVNGTVTYMITVDKKADGTCPVNARFEYIEIDGALAAENHIPVYATCGNFFIDHAYIHNVGRASRLTNNSTIQNSYIFSDRTGDSGTHRGAVGINGGSNNVIRNNVLKCKGTGCSASIPNYGDFSPVQNLTIEHNLVATTGGYCMYGGSLDDKPFPDGSNIKIINNHFSREFHPKCGRFGTLAGWEGGVRGNEASGNVWYETGEPIIFQNDIGV